MSTCVQLEGVQRELEKFSVDSRELFLDADVPVMQSQPDPLEFYRSYVAPNKPVVIQNAINHWSALKKWNNDYLRSVIGDENVTVAITPNGYADAVTDGKFVMPYEKVLKMSEFLSVIENSDKYDDVYYIQKQNSNLTDEFAKLLTDVDSDIKFGSIAFGTKPDAVNFWMGDKQAVTSMHKDHYENLYCVVKGWKKFILIPPSDQPFVPYKSFKQAVYNAKSDGSYEIKTLEPENEVPWIPIDPLKPDLIEHPEFQKARPIEVLVREGEILYLPSLWFHHVQQSHGCIAVNYWYDMEFDLKYTYYNLVKSISNLVN